jgi:hypothetical protein
VNEMLTEYGIAESDSLTGQYIALKDSLHRSECSIVFRKYNSLVEASDSARKANDFILAYNTINEAVNLSLDNINCKIKDDEAWYSKVMLEAPADFQKKEKGLDTMVAGPYTEYLVVFQELKNYYYRKKLLEQGVVFIPLFERVMQVKDTAFLMGMLKHYIGMKDYDHALKLLGKLHELGIPSGTLKDEQKKLASSLARRDAQATAVDAPWKTLGSYTGHDKWYHSFNWKYKFTWLKETGWKMKYWPFIWKK